MSFTKVTRGLVLAAAVALVATTAPAANAAISYRSERIAAADWEGDQLTAGQIPYIPAGFGTDWGLTIDAMFEFAADGTQPLRQARTKLAIERHILDYTTYTDPTTHVTTTYANSSSKALVAASVMGDDPGDVNGVNIRRQVLDLIQKTGAAHGRVADSTYPTTDYSNTLGQAYAVIGMARAHRLSDHPFVVSYLLKQQCSGGGFRLNETDTQCTSKGADVDATALAIQAMNAARGIGGVPVDNAKFVGAVTWLKSRQHADGSFSEHLGLPHNANSTGLAAQAFGSSHQLTALHRAQAWMAGVQLTKAKAGSGKGRTDIGAIAFNHAALLTARKDGITSATRDQFRRATAQGSFAFSPIPLATLSLP